ncbi:MAG TPA: DUF4389 domain-containing protein [Thermomicrobiales bacterium]|jgi:hypothetical protein|nr:DUF4389 domain-containing protein [Chloroflexota bacterium]HBY45683.1 DUF4389 domain-containing protein [Chloroflexota bacterium]HCG30379.1 DUF4389 domain-containing protein [Chloroflexota bacterium]HQZ91341.1 DUF4389 domain-containing protein [Thermomicrobiales bacterium]
MATDAATKYPVTFTVDYPDRPMNRLTTAFRILLAIPIFVILGLFGQKSTIMIGAGGLLVVPILLMIVIRQKYPRWWYEFNLHLLRFSNRAIAYLALLNDEYPSTDEEQGVHLEMSYPDVKNDLSRWAPLYKWFLAIPHYFVLTWLMVGVVLAVQIAWFAILITGRYPRGLFDFVVGVLRWHNRVVGYAIALVTDQYPPFSLKQ